MISSIFSNYVVAMQFGPAVLGSIPVLAVNLVDDASVMTIIYASNLLENMFGYDAGELLGQPLDRLIPADSIDIHHVHIKNFQNAPSTPPINRCVYGVKKDGSIIKVQVGLSVQEIGEIKMVVAYIVLVIDDSLSNGGS